jgi:hypothetical protein
MEDEASTPSDEEIERRMAAGITQQTFCELNNFMPRRSLGQIGRWRGFSPPRVRSGPRRASIPPSPLQRNQGDLWHKRPVHENVNEKSQLFAARTLRDGSPDPILTLI